MTCRCVLIALKHRLSTKVNFDYEIPEGTLIDTPHPYSFRNLAMSVQAAGKSLTAENRSFYAAS